MALTWIVKRSKTGVAGWLENLLRQTRGKRILCDHAGDPLMTPSMKRERLRHSRVQSSTLAAAAIQIEVLFRPAKMADNIKPADGFSLGCGAGGSRGGKTCAQSRFFCPTAITGQEFAGVRVFDEDVYAKCLLKRSVRVGNDGRAGGIRRGGAHERRGLSVFRGCGCAGGKRRQGGGGEAGDDEIFHKLNYCCLPMRNYALGCSSAMGCNPTLLSLERGGARLEKASVNLSAIPARWAIFRKDPSSYGC